MIRHSCRSLKPLIFASVYSLTLCLATTIAARADSHPDLRFGVLYGLQNDFWDKVDTLKAGKQSPAEISNLLNSSFDNPTEGILSASGLYEDEVNEKFSRWFSHGYFGLRADGLVGGDIRNRILPDLRGYSVFTGSVEMGLAKHLADSEESGWAYRVSSSLGAGQQKLVQGSAVDFFDDVPIETSMIFFSGFDLEGSYRNRLGEALVSTTRLGFYPTFFHSDSSESGYQLRIRQNSVFARWRLENEWDAVFDPSSRPIGAVGFQLISGQQPTPTLFLPRTWDSIHDLQFLPSFGQLVGVGTVLRLNFADEVQLQAFGGFYGGYFGAGGRLSIYAVTLFAGTYGLEQTSGYRIEESRIQYAGLSAKFDL